MSALFSLEPLAPKMFVHVPASAIGGSSLNCVCQAAGLPRNHWTDFHETWCKAVVWLRRKHWGVFPHWIWFIREWVLHSDEIFMSVCNFVQIQKKNLSLVDLNVVSWAFQQLYGNKQSQEPATSTDRAEKRDVASATRLVLIKGTVGPWCIGCVKCNSG